jgi:predicted RNA-binding protein with PIN domain
MPYLIDGHNLIPKIGLRLDSPDDEMELVTMLQEFVRLSRRPVEVYFDGAPAGSATTRRAGLVKVHFVRAGTPADEAIKHRLQSLGSAARNWTVVSSDHQVQNAGRAAHARVLSAEQFVGGMAELQERARKASDEQAPSPEEIEHWLKLFDKGS